MSRKSSAALVIAILGVAIGIAVSPFLIGLLGAPVLATTFDTPHRWLKRRLSDRWAATWIVIAALLAIFIPVVGITALVVSEIPSVLAGPSTARIIESLAGLHIGPFAFGRDMATLSSDIVTWTSRQAVVLLGSVTFMAINMLIAFLGLYFILMAGATPWRYIARFLPFSAATAERLRLRFHDVTRATVLGIGVTAVLQGTIVGTSFALVGLGHPVLWGTVTGIVSVLPVLGSAIVWLPGAVVLALDDRFAAATVVAMIGFIVASNIDNLVRPIVFRRVSNIHPLIAVVGAFAGMRYFGLLGVLLGPLALVYFIELVRAFEHEYVNVNANVATLGVPAPPRLVD